MLSKMLRGSVNNTTNPPATDHSFNQVSLLLHGDGTNGAQNNTFLDSSTNNFTITRNGNTTQGTNTPFSQAAGYWSNYFDGTGDYLTSPASTSYEVTTADFTIEFWVYPTAFTAEQLPFSYLANIGGYALAAYFTSGLVRFIYNGLNVVTSTATLLLNTWAHIAYVRNSGTFVIYVNGVNVGSTAMGSITASSYPLYIGGSTTSFPFSGYMSNFRVVNGTAVYTANFTPPTAPLTAITNTSLLTCQSNNFKDNSSNNFTITRNGDTSVQPFSPFAPTSAYSTSVNGGSMYFDGTGDYLSVADNANLRFGTSAFTIQSWVYRNAAGTAHSIVSKGGASTGFTFGITSTNVLRFTNTTTNIDTTTTIPANAWTHVAAVRTNTSTNGFQLYINGVSSATATVSTDFNQTETLYAGADRSASTVMNGYIADLRYVNGTAETITVPTAPLTAITNTSLLLSGTNAGIYDNAIKNDLETVGSAQVSTSVVKYGTGSMKFNGTTDYLNSPISPQFAFGTGAWTIEGWVYSSSVTVLQSLIDTRATATSTTGVLVSITALGFISVTVNNAILFTSSTAMTLSTWTHVAVVKNGTTITLYLDGTKPTTGSGTSSTSLTDQYLRLGASAGTAANFYNGYLDDVRITKGIARYTANFTAPTSAFPNS